MRVSKKAEKRRSPALVEGGFYGISSQGAIREQKDRPMSKYRNKKTAVDGITFASKKEARRYTELHFLMKAGEITGLELQRRYPIVVKNIKVCTYVADFDYFDKAGKKIVEDVKGVKTPIYRLKKKLMLACYGIEITEV